MATERSAAKVRRDYSLRSSDADEVHGEFHANGFIRIAPGAATAGDLLVVRPGPATLHIVIVTDTGYIHADMRSRRVVEAPGPAPWPILSAWRDRAIAAEDPLAPELIGPGKMLN